MALKDYEALDENDFYGQPFDQEGRVSVWVGLDDGSEDPEDLDVLQDLCGVGYYEIDQQEICAFDYQDKPVRELLSQVSYAPSFAEAAARKAEASGLGVGKYVLVQYEFAYDPEVVKRKPEKDPVFVGHFAYEQG